MNWFTARLAVPVMAVTVAAFGVELLVRPSTHSPRHEIPQVDYFVPAQSFSEIENEKAVLRGLSSRFATEVLSHYFPARLTGSAQRNDPAREARRSKAIQELERGIREFADGPKPEILLTKELFIFLKNAGQYDRWVDTYLDLIYQHPMEDLVGQCAKEALDIARKIGRENELLDAFHFLAGIPRNFTSKSQAARALSEFNARDRRVNKSAEEL